MISDYSSVAFDFAYMLKPVIYYQYSHDYNFEEGYFKYKTMGFGEVIEKEDKLIDVIKEYIENNCEMKEEYIKRVDSFYKYNDKNNCRRVYDAILKM
ncbi:CDP-glycerol glycerophosphotransferase family protein, partial [Methanobrevibacter sp.]|uniref:CDP-glycerol glycerophosphotransferase family protein n=1 Tax=Methanobrevibacter sp. TaxID=66852 RepID=UPI0026DF113D